MYYVSPFSRCLMGSRLWKMVMYHFVFSIVDVIKLLCYISVFW